MLSLALSLTALLVQQQATLVVTDRTGSFNLNTNPDGYDGPNASEDALTHRLLISPTAPHALSEGSYLVDVPAAAASLFGSPFPDQLNVCFVPLPGDGIWQVRLLAIWVDGALPFDAPVNTLVALASGALVATRTIGSLVNARPVSVAELARDLQENAVLQVVGEAVEYVAVTFEIDRFLAQQLLEVAISRHAVRGAEDRYHTHRLLVFALGKALELKRPGDAAALLGRLRTSLFSASLPNALQPCS